MATESFFVAGYMLIWPWLYPLYYVILLFSRQRGWWQAVRLKYGDLWKTYVKEYSPDYTFNLLEPNQPEIPGNS